MTAAEYFDRFRSDIVNSKSEKDRADVAWRICLAFSDEAHRKVGKRRLSNAQFLSLILEFDAKWEELRQIIIDRGFAFHLQTNGFRETIFFQVPELQALYEQMLKRKN